MGSRANPIAVLIILAGEMPLPLRLRFAAADFRHAAEGS
jgi:hypothetical protein